MALQIKLKKEELALVDIIRHPILGPEFIRNFNDIPEDENISFGEDKDLYYEHRDYQRLMLCDFNSHVTLCCARAVGKTESLIDKITFYLINDFWPNQYITFLAPNDKHINPVFDRLRQWLQTNDFLRKLVDKRSINSAAKTVKLKSGGTLYCRIAGTTGTGQNVVGLHTPVVLVDEAAYFPWGTWLEMQPIFNHWMNGSQMMVAGVPDGRREKSVLYHTDQKAEGYTQHRIPSSQNPTWDEGAEKKAQEDYGGINSEDYIHMVLGEHGSPVFSVFDRNTMKIEGYDTVAVELRGKEIELDPQAGARQIMELPPLPRNAENVLFGIDLGFTEPTAIIVMYMTSGIWHQLCRLTWYSIEFNLQEKLIAYLDNKYNPSVIGIDEGGQGKPVVQDLLSNDFFREHNFKEKIVPINFASTVSIGQDEDGNDLKIRAKEFSVQYLQQLTTTNRIAYSKLDEDLISEFERTTYTKSIGGQLSFKTFTERGGQRGADHTLAAYLSGFLAWYIKRESAFSAKPKPVLTRFRWNY